MAARLSCFSGSHCSFVLGLQYIAGHCARRAIGGEFQLHTWANSAALSVVQFMDDAGWSHERVWTWPVVSRSRKMCGFAVCTPGGDEYVEALTDDPFYAQTVRQGSTFAYSREVNGKRGTVFGGDLWRRDDPSHSCQPRDGGGCSGRGGVPWNRCRSQQLLQLLPGENGPVTDRMACGIAKAVDQHYKRT